MMKNAFPIPKIRLYFKVVKMNDFLNKHEKFECYTLSESSAPLLIIACQLNPSLEF